MAIPARVKSIAAAVAAVAAVGAACEASPESENGPIASRFERALYLVEPDGSV